jgi:hypothetical protein
MRVPVHARHALPGRACRPPRRRGFGGGPCFPALSGSRGLDNRLEDAYLPACPPSGVPIPAFRAACALCRPPGRASAPGEARHPGHRPGGRPLPSPFRRRPSQPRCPGAQPPRRSLPRLLYRLRYRSLRPFVALPRPHPSLHPFLALPPPEPLPPFRPPPPLPPGSPVPPPPAARPLPPTAWGRAPDAPPPGWGPRHAQPPGAGPRKAPSP